MSNEQNKRNIGGFNKHELSHIVSYLPKVEWCRLQLLNRHTYDVTLPDVMETSDCKVKFYQEDVSEVPMFVQYYEGCLLVIDMASSVEQMRRERTERLPTLQWQAILPNPLSSDNIQRKMFFGRAILVPGRRVFVISGSLDQKVTDNLSDEVQEWDLDTMAVKKV